MPKLLVLDPFFTEPWEEGFFDRILKGDGDSPNLPEESLGFPSYPLPLDAQRGDIQPLSPRAEAQDRALERQKRRAQPASNSPFGESLRQKLRHKMKPTKKPPKTLDKTGVIRLYTYWGDQTLYKSIAILLKISYSKDRRHVLILSDLHFFITVYCLGWYYNDTFFSDIRLSKHQFKILGIITGFHSFSSQVVANKKYDFCCFKHWVEFVLVPPQKSPRQKKTIAVLEGFQTSLSSKNIHKL